MYWSKIPWKVILYCAGFSYSFMFYCSMVATPADFYNSVLFIAPRYSFLSLEISAFLLGVAVCFLLSRTAVFKIMGYVILGGCSVIAILTYPVNVIGVEYANAYPVNIGVFQKDGKDRVSIPIGPWAPWTLTVPADLPDTFTEDMNIEVSAIQKDRVVRVSGWIGKDEQPYKRLFLKLSNQAYLAAAFLKSSAVSETGDLRQEYTFEFDVGVFPGDDLLEFIGQTLDGEYHSRKLNVHSPDDI